MCRSTCLWIALQERTTELWRHAKWNGYISLTGPADSLRCVNGVMSIERGSAMSADVGKPADYKYWRCFEHLHRVLWISVRFQRRGMGATVSSRCFVGGDLGRRWILNRFSTPVWRALNAREARLISRYSISRKIKFSCNGREPMAVSARARARMPLTSRNKKALDPVRSRSLLNNAAVKLLNIYIHIYVYIYILISLSLFLPLSLTFVCTRPKINIHRSRAPTINSAFSELRHGERFFIVT